MALTDAEKHLVFEVFGIPESTDVLYVDGRFGTGKTNTTGAVLITRDALFARMDNLPQHLEDRLRELLAQWSKVSTSAVLVKPNTANEGVDVNPARTRRLIRERVRMIVPVWVEDRVGPGSNAIPVG